MLVETETLKACVSLTAGSFAFFVFPSASIIIPTLFFYICFLVVLLPQHLKEMNRHKSCQNDQIWSFSQKRGGLYLFFLSMKFMKI